MKARQASTKIADNSAQTTAGPVGKLTVALGRYREGAPIFGYAITEEGRIPFIASAAIAGPNHALILDDETRKHVTTGYSAQEVEQRARLFAASPDLLGTLRTIAAMIGNVDHSTGNGPNSAKMRGQLLNDFRDMANAAIAKATLA